MMSNADRVRALALSLPSTYEDTPWGFPVFKVGDNKLFAMMTDHDGDCELTVKLSDDERDVALQLPNVRRASYVGRYGWVTVRVADEESLDAALDGAEPVGFVLAHDLRRRHRDVLTERENVPAMRLYRTVGGRDEGDNVVWDFEHTAR